jgi:hypothetical protein
MGDPSESGMGEQFRPMVAHREQIAPNRAVQARMKVVDVAAAGEVHDDEAAVGLERAGEVAEGGGLVAEVGEGVETEDDIVAGDAEVIVAYIDAGEVGGDIFGAGLGDHLGGEVDGGDAAGRDAGGEPGGGFSGAAADLEEGVSGFEIQEGGVLVEALGHGGRGGFLGIPGGREVIKEGDTGVGKNHTIFSLRNTHSGATLLQNRNIACPSGQARHAGGCYFDHV